MRVLSTARAVLLSLTSSKTPCVRVLDVFSSVCILHVPRALSLPAFCLLYVHNIDICSIFEPIPSFLCVHVNVEMTSIVELFSDHFSFSVKSGMWTDQCCPLRAVACAACVLLIISFTKSQIQAFLMKYCCLLTTSPKVLANMGLNLTKLFILVCYYLSNWFLSIWESSSYCVCL